MTRIAAGHPAIWPDICVQNADPIVDALDELISELSAIRDVVSERDRAALLARLESARVARRNLPTTIPSTEAMSEMRIPVLDRKVRWLQSPPWLPISTSTSTTSRSLTLPKVLGVSSCSSSRRR